MGKYSLPTTFILLITLANLLASLAHSSNCPPPEHSPKFPPKHPPKVKPPFHPKPPVSHPPPSTPSPVVPKPPPVVVHPPPPYVPKLPPPVVVQPPPPYVPKLPPPVVVQPPPPYVPKLPPPVVVQPPPHVPELPPPVVVKPPPTGTPCPPPPPPKDTCPIDALKLGACVDVLGGLVHIGIGSSAKQACCPLLQGLADLDAAVCLCTTIKAKLLNINILIPIALQVLIDCGKYPPAGFQCPP